jgi:hypothetical protein
MVNLDYRVSMTRSFLNLVALLVLLGLASCATKQPPPRPVPQPFAARTSTLSITNGLKVLSEITLPGGFVPAPNHPPMWLQEGDEIGLVGKVGPDTVVLGYSGKDWRTARILAADSGAAAAEQGRIVDVAVSPNSLTLASAVVVPGARRLDVIIRDLIAVGPGNPIASFDGDFDSATLSWINNSTIALALRAHPEPQPAPQPAVEDEEAEPPPKPADGLQFVVVTGAASVVPVDLKCAMSPLSWSPGGAYAIGQGDSEAPPILINRRTSQCLRFGTVGPVHVLDWDTDREGVFLYVAPDQSGRSSGIYRHSIEDGTDKLIAVSSGAAAMSNAGETIVLGNQKLTFGIAIERPTEPLLAQVAVSDPDQQQIALKGLGFDTTAPMLAASTMTYSHGQDEVAIQTFAPGEPAPWRKIISYSLQDDSAFLLATGAWHGTASMSWSTHGRWLAIVDGEQNLSTLTIILPPQ